MALRIRDRQYLDYLFGSNMYNYRSVGTVLSVYDKNNNLLIADLEKFKKEEDSIIPQEKSQWICTNYDIFHKDELVKETITILEVVTFQGVIMFKVWSDLYKQVQNIGLALILKYFKRRK